MFSVSCRVHTMGCLAQNVFMNNTKTYKGRGAITARVNRLIGKMSTIKKILQSRQELLIDTGNKVTVVGVGKVGTAAIFTMLARDVTNNVAMVDANAEKLKGELMDFQHGTAFMYNANIEASTNFKITKDSQVCVITAGVRQKVGEDRRSLVERNVKVLKIIVPQIVEHSPNVVIVVASNPVDVLTYVTWKISGLPKYRVIGSGTNLDSARFRFLLAQRLGIATTSCHGYIIGEHGDSSVPVWSGVNIAGMKLKDLNENIGLESDNDNWKEIHTAVVQSAYEVIKLKGYTSWAIGLSLSQIVKAILFNTGKVLAVTTSIKGEQGITDDVFLSLPCVIGRNGVRAIIRQTLAEIEKEQLLKSAALMADMQSKLNL